MAYEDRSQFESRNQPPGVRPYSLDFNLIASFEEFGDLSAAASVINERRGEGTIFYGIHPKQTYESGELLRHDNGIVRIQIDGSYKEYSSSNQRAVEYEWVDLANTIYINRLNGWNNDTLERKLIERAEFSMILLKDILVSNALDTFVFRSDSTKD